MFFVGLLNVSHKNPPTPFLILLKIPIVIFFVFITIYNKNILIMGQRLIITEEERTRIAGIYGLVNEQIDDPAIPSSKTTLEINGYKVGPIKGTGHLKDVTFDVSNNSMGSHKIKIQSELRQSSALNQLEFNYSYIVPSLVPSQSNSGFIAPAMYNCSNKKLLLPYDPKGGKEVKYYEISSKISSMFNEYCFRPKK